MKQKPEARKASGFFCSDRSCPPFLWKKIILAQANNTVCLKRALNAYIVSLFPVNPRLLTSCFSRFYATGSQHQTQDACQATPGS
jgi:hypothetical protein